MLHSLDTCNVRLQRYKVPPVEMTPLNVNSQDRVDSERRRLLASEGRAHLTQDAQRKVRYVVMHVAGF